MRRLAETLSAITVRAVLYALPAIAVAYTTFAALWWWRNPGCSMNDYVSEALPASGDPCGAKAETVALLYWVAAWGVGTLTCWPLTWLKNHRARARG